MKQLTIDVTQVANMQEADIIARGRPVGRMPDFNKVSDIQLAAMNSSLSMASVLSDEAKMAKEILDMGSSAPSYILKTTSASILSWVSSKSFTVALGLSASAALGILTGGAGGGVYGCPSPKELGFYLAANTGLVLINVGVFLGGQFQFVLGPPSLYFKGYLYGIGADISITELIGIEVLLLFSVPPGMRLVGFAFSAGKSKGELPFNLTIQLGNTWLFPLVK